MRIRQETRPETIAFSALLVDVQDDLVDSISKSLLMPVRRESDISAACKRMVTARPYVVVVGGAPTSDELARLEEHALATSAQLVLLASLGDLATLDERLKAAKREAILLRDRPPTSVKL